MADALIRVPHGPGVVVWLETSLPDKDVRVLWMDDVAAPPVLAALSGPVVVVQPLRRAAAAAPQPAPESSPGNAEFALFGDATVNSLTCWQALAFLSGQDADRLRDVLPRLQLAIQNANAVRADNPRRAWVLGAQQWYAPPGTSPAEIDRKQQAAIAIYEAALPAARAERVAARDPRCGWHLD